MLSAKFITKHIFFLSSFFIIGFFLTSFIKLDSSKPIYADAPATPDTSFWVFNSIVYDMVRKDDILYLGGTFTHVGPNTGSGIPLALSDGERQADFPRIKGDVNTAITDNNDGWYIAGEFTHIGGTGCTGIAHLAADGTIDTNFTTTVNSSVNALVLSEDGNTLYLGGYFTEVNSTAMEYVAAVNTSDGSLLAGWDANINGQIHTLAFSGTTLFIGGLFGTVNGTSRNHVAAISAANGSLISGFNANSSNGVFDRVDTLLIDSSTLYIGGRFTSMGGQARNYLAAVGVTNGTATSWNPNVNNYVYALAIDDNYVYAGGSFTQIGGNDHYALAQINKSSAVASSWANTPDGGDYGGIFTLKVIGTTLYAGGQFEALKDSTVRFNLAAYNLTDLSLTDWNPMVGDPVRCLEPGNSVIFTGGDFNSVNGLARSYLASLDLTTGQATDWNPYLDWEVYDLEIGGEILYLGGYFENVGDNEAGAEARTYLAAFNLTNHTLTNFNPSPDDLVQKILVNGNNIYIAGDFTAIGVNERLTVAKLGLNGDLDTDWTADTDGFSTYDLENDDSSLYVGGDFTTINGVALTGLAKISLADGTVDESWDIQLNSEVYALEKVDDYLYVGGNFTAIGGEDLANLARLDIGGTNADATWTPEPNQSIEAIRNFGTNLYIGGNFSQIANQNQADIAIFSTTTDSLINWNPGIENGGEGDAGVYAFEESADGETTYLGGSFIASGNTPLFNFGRFGESLSSPTNTPTPTNTNSPTPTLTPIPTNTDNANKNTNNQSNYSVNPWTCGKPKPGIKSIWLYAALPYKNNSIKLFFTPADQPFDRYVVWYGFNRGQLIYGGEFMATSDTRTLVIKDLEPNANYVFKIRAGNGCATGDWSNEISATTSLASFTKQIEARNTGADNPTPTTKPVNPAQPSTTVSPEQKTIIPTPSPVSTPNQPSLWQNISNFFKNIF